MIRRPPVESEAKQKLNDFWSGGVPCQYRKISSEPPQLLPSKWKPKAPSYYLKKCVTE
jgi:hypothetical protein